MDRPGFQAHDGSEHAEHTFEPKALELDVADGGDDAESSWLDEIVARLEADPDECWPAIESLSAVDEETRVRVIAALAAYSERRGVRDLLRLLASAREPAVSRAAATALHQRHETDTRNGRHPPSDRIGFGAPIGVGTAGVPATRTERDRTDLGDRVVGPRVRLVRSLVTALDGEGRGTIVLSAGDRGYRRTAAFRCDVCWGVLDAVGEVEEEGPSAGGMVDDWVKQGGGDEILDVPELAARLLEGCFLLSGPEIPDHVRAWRDATIGPTTVAVGLAAALPGPTPKAVPDDEMTRCVEHLLDACPKWLDRSALAGKLAMEIALREGRATSDPIRDAGAYRYLFEHRLIGRLELYARMLLWMAWLWQADGRPELSRSAFALAAQLCEEQYAVPSHPFTVSLTTRSFLAAQEELLAIGRSGIRD